MENRKFRKSGVSKAVLMADQDLLRKHAGYKTTFTIRHYTQMRPVHDAEPTNRLPNPAVENARDRSSPSPTSAGDPSNRTLQTDRDRSDEGA